MNRRGRASPLSLWSRCVLRAGWTIMMGTNRASIHTHTHIKSGTEPTTVALECTVRCYISVYTVRVLLFGFSLRPAAAAALFRFTITKEGGVSLSLADESEPSLFHII